MTESRVNALLNLVLSSYGSLLSSGRVTSVQNEAEVESSRTSAAVTSLRSATYELLGICSSLRMEATLAHVSRDSVLSRGIWMDLDERKVGAWVGEEVGHLSLTFRDFEQCQTATAVLDGGRRTLFIKRASVSWLRASGVEKTPDAWEVSTRSFCTELTLFKSLSPHLESISRAGAPCVRCFHAEEEAGGVYTSVLENLVNENWEEVGRCGRLRAEGVLAWLGAFHAYWWGRVPEGLFCPGGWWRMELKPTVDYSSIPSVFLSHCTALASFRELDTPKNHKLLKALTRHCTRLHSEAACTLPNTLLHGDVKTSNMVFPRPPWPVETNAAPTLPPDKPPSPLDGPPPPPAIPTLFDFQWAGGAGSGLADVAYFLVGGVEKQDILTPGSIDGFLTVYRSALLKGLAARGLDVGVKGSPECIREDFERELVLYFSTALPCLLSGLTPEKLAKNKEKYGWLTHEQEESVLQWLTQYVLRILERWDLPEI